MMREVRDWVHRVGAEIPPRDRVTLLTPPIIAARIVRYALKLHKREIPADDPSLRDTDLLAPFIDFFRFIARTWFRLQVEGIEHVPERGPALLVGNHNGALVPMDGCFTLLAIWDSFGPTRGVSMLAHDFLMEDDVFRRYMMRFGAVRAGHTGARRALRAGNLVLVYPGGDVECFRPFRERARIDLAGRTGFVELALRERVPIVPVVSAGTHEQLIVLTRGDRIARLLRLQSWARTRVFPIVLSFPWGVTSGLLPYVPPPVQTTLAFGEPIAWPELGPAAADDPATVARCYAEVERRMQGILDRLYEGRRFLLGTKSNHATNGRLAAGG